MTLDLSRIAVSTTRNSAQTPRFVAPCRPGTVARSASTRLAKHDRWQPAGWHFVVVTDADQKKLWAACTGIQSETERHRPSRTGGRDEVRAYLAEHLQEVPVLVIPCIEGRYENAPPRGKP